MAKTMRWQIPFPSWQWTKQIRQAVTQWIKHLEVNTIEDKPQEKWYPRMDGGNIFRGEYQRSNPQREGHGG